MSTNHHFWRGVPKWGLEPMLSASAYQPKALPLGRMGSPGQQSDQRRPNTVLRDFFYTFKVRLTKGNSGQNPTWWPSQAKRKKEKKEDCNINTTSAARVSQLWKKKKKNALDWITQKYLDLVVKNDYAMSSQSETKHGAAIFLSANLTF